MGKDVNVPADRSKQRFGREEGKGEGEGRNEGEGGKKGRRTEWTNSPLNSPFKFNPS